LGADVEHYPDTKTISVKAADINNYCAPYDIVSKMRASIWVLSPLVARFNKARACKLTLPHGEVLTPIYMPVGTKAAMKGLLSLDLERMGCKLMLSNTYHLALQPGEEFLEKNFNKCIPAFVYSSNMQYIAGIIGGYFISDAEFKNKIEEEIYRLTKKK
jgi:hypothetical protein